MRKRNKKNNPVIVYVSKKHGNDLTALVGSEHNPFFTFKAAIDAARKVENGNYKN